MPLKVSAEYKGYMRSGLALSVSLVRRVLITTATILMISFSLKHACIVGDTGAGALMLELDLAVDLACDLEVCIFSLYTYLLVVARFRTLILLSIAYALRQQGVLGDCIQSLR